ncbi:38913_t:CDS:2, partial [Gigaspora margarita]
SSVSEVMRWKCLPEVSKCYKLLFEKTREEAFWCIAIARFALSEESTPIFTNTYYAFALSHDFEKGIHHTNQQTIADDETRILRILSQSSHEALTETESQSAYQSTSMLLSQEDDQLFGLTNCLIS